MTSYLYQQEVSCCVAKHGPDHLKQRRLGVEPLHPGDDTEHLGHVGDGGDHFLQRVQGQLGTGPHLVRQQPRLLEVDVLGLGGSQNQF